MAKKTPKKINTDEKEKLRFQKKLRKDVRQIFTNAGFAVVPQEDIDADIKGQKSDFDNIFIFENLVIFAEDTIVTSNKNDHLRKKAEFFKHCNDNRSDLVAFLKQNIPAYKNSTAGTFTDNDLNLAFLYVSLHEVDAEHQKRYKPTLTFMDKKVLSYFSSLSKTIKKSARFEIFKFLDIDFEKIGSQRSGSTGNDYTGLILPETPSGFPNGYRLVSFLIDPAMLLRQSYVLRKDGWQDNDFVYQRILLPSKILNMRKYLTEEGRVFVNNIIVTLPKDVQLINTETNTVITTVNASAVKHPVKISIPQQAGNVGIIDGQHRVFSYHEGDDTHEPIISQMRDKQHLLVTGIMFPANITGDERMRFEAKLFLEINDKQTRTNAALRQVIGTIVNPFSEVSIAKMVVSELAKRDPMKNILEQHFFDKGKLKTTSIVSYGMRHVVKLSGNDSFFSVWKNRKKNTLEKGKDRVLLDQYVKFCSDDMNAFLQAFKKNVPAGMWTTDQKVSRVLTATTITGLIHCMRVMIENKKRGKFNKYDKGFKKLAGKIDFTPAKFSYKSSHWKDLGDKIYETCFK
jgi:DGQHR domain-containing protein